MGHYTPGTAYWAKSQNKSPNVWYHVAGAVDRSKGTIKIYVDGKPEGTEYFPAGSPSRSSGNTLLLGIGNPTTQSGVYQSFREAFNGKIDDVRIYNRTLSDAQITELANTIAPRL
jgi:hypothetical protein